MFDREGNGFITVPDLTEVLLKLGEKLSSEECQGQSVSRDYGKTFYYFVVPNVLKVISRH